MARLTSVFPSVWLSILSLVALVGTAAFLCGDEVTRRALELPLHPAWLALGAVGVMTAVVLNSFNRPCPRVTQLASLFLLTAAIGAVAWTLIAEPRGLPSVLVVSVLVASLVQVPRLWRYRVGKSAVYVVPVVVFVLAAPGLLGCSVWLVKRTTDLNQDRVDQAIQMLDSQAQDLEALRSNSAWMDVGRVDQHLEWLDSVDSCTHAASLDWQAAVLVGRDEELAQAELRLMEAAADLASADHAPRLSASNDWGIKGGKESQWSTPALILDRSSVVRSYHRVGWTVFRDIAPASCAQAPAAAQSAAAGSDTSEQIVEACERQRVKVLAGFQTLSEHFMDAWVLSTMDGVAVSEDAGSMEHLLSRPLFGTVSLADQPALYQLTFEDAEQAMMGDGTCQVLDSSDAAAFGISVPSYDQIACVAYQGPPDAKDAEPLLLVMLSWVPGQAALHDVYIVLAGPTGTEQNADFKARFLSSWCAAIEARGGRCTEASRTTGARSIKWDGMGSGSILYAGGSEENEKQLGTLRVNGVGVARRVTSELTYPYTRRGGS